MNKELTVDHENTVSLGKKFASLREKLGLTQADLAAKMHIDCTIIQAIDRDETLDISSVYVKSYIKSYAEIVGLPPTEYQSYLDSKISQCPNKKMKNYSHKNQQRNLVIRIIFMSLIIILITLGITYFLVWKENKNNFVEVSHYVSPTSSADNIQIYQGGIRS